MRVVLDSNVFVSALAFPGSVPDQVLRHARRGDFELFTSRFILEEVRRVLRRKFGLSDRDARAAVRAIRAVAREVRPTERVRAVEAEDDNRILECAMAARAHFLVTGDRRHLLPLRCYRGTAVVSPADFLLLLAEGGSGPMRP